MFIEKGSVLNTTKIELLIAGSSSEMLIVIIKF